VTGADDLRGAGDPTGFRILDEQERYRGYVAKVVTARLQSPDGEEYSRDIVRHPGAVAVVPVIYDEGGAGPVAVLIRQYRAPLGQSILEVPAGLRDVDGEPPEQTAHRELAEEVGLRAGRMEKLCEFFTSPGISDERVWVYLGLDLEPVPRGPQSHEEKYLTEQRVALEDVDAMIQSGQICDAKTIVGLALARQVLS
jgi:ADP-ribose pyrophosphatase